jgi:DNA-binding XRE family transcriptional regulator
MYYVNTKDKKINLAMNIRYLINYTKMTVNQRLKEARKTLKISQKDFADAICISNTFLASLENESRKVNGVCRKTLF